MLKCEKKQLLDYLNDYYELRDKSVLTANEYALIFKIIDENPSKDTRELIPVLTAEIDNYRKKYMDFIMPKYTRKQWENIIKELEKRKQQKKEEEEDVEDEI